MVVVLQLDDGGDALLPHAHRGLDGAADAPPLHPPVTPREAVPNVLSAILACYPVAAELASHLDLNTLHALARTSRSTRAQLLPQRRQLAARALRCANERPSKGNPRVRPVTRATFAAATSPGGVPTLRLTAEGGAGPCARDLVGPCRRCRRIVCRNCISKPRPASALAARLRRLCAACARAPLADLAGHAPLGLPPLTAPACSCAAEVFVCGPCGHSSGSADLGYRRLWAWRMRYSTRLGGLGTGIGEGSEGVKCARDRRCAAACESEVEVDCRSAREIRDLMRQRSELLVQAHMTWVPLDADNADWASDDDESADGASTATGTASTAATSVQGGQSGGDNPGYHRQEMEGIGGIVRSKVKKRVRVGHAVEEHEDERALGLHMGREARGEVRAWCGWCDRVVLGPRDLDGEE